MSYALPIRSVTSNLLCICDVVVNCLEIEIPESLCDMEMVEVLSLNGLAGGDNCRSDITIPLFETSLQLAKDFEIPSCLWSLNKLTTLHLTGNGYVGEMVMLETGRRLNDVSLSHNRLEGTIPSFVQALKKVDVSHNRFVGHLSSVPNTSSGETELHAQVNRLSGRLPASDLQRVQIVDVLRGNMFSCDSIPENDVNRRGYICGESSEVILLLKLNVTS